MPNNQSTNMKELAAAKMTDDCWGEQRCAAPYSIFKRLLFLTLVAHSVGIAGAFVTPTSRKGQEAAVVKHNQGADAGGHHDYTSTATGRKTSDGERMLHIERPLPNDPSVGVCHICPVQGSTLDGNKNPALEESTLSDLKLKIPDLAVINDLSNDIGSWTCKEWDNFAANHAVLAYSATCVDLQDRLLRRCCNGLPHLFECAEGVLHGRSEETHLNNVPPILDGESMWVEVQFEVLGMSIQDYGLAGGSIDIYVRTSMSWVDERLAWNESEKGCASIMVADDDIWAPQITANNEQDVQTEKVAKVMADGRVNMTHMEDIIISCETHDYMAKECKAEYEEQNLGYDVKYSYTVVLNLENDTGLLAEEYELRQDQITVDQVRDKSKPLLFLFYFEPVNKKCNLCGNGPSKLSKSRTIENIPGIWQRDYNRQHKDGLSCQEMHDFLASLSVTNDACEKGQAYFEGQCCDGYVASSHDCESNIHDQIVEKYNTISPPDPSPEKNGASEISNDRVSVNVSLDILHIFEIDVKLSYMSLLVALDLSWYDERLSWEPFIGGCRRVSYRASSDDSQNAEIWVPAIELLNQVEGIQTLPTSHASVHYDGRVSWRRTGVLEGSCALTGVEKFPFGKTGCFMDFGGTRDPLYHRIKFVPKRPDYSKRVKMPSGFQEYEMKFEQTWNTTETETLSGFSNEVIRYHFYFSRASSYYMRGFVLLYILFTYLSFGMFFVDYSMGERLAYGSSILFVMVAQDITLSETIPVTKEDLWISQLSLGSKIFVIAGIFQSLVILYVFSHHKLKEERSKGHRERNEEIRPFIHEPGQEVCNEVDSGQQDDWSENEGIRGKGGKDRQTPALLSESAEATANAAGIGVVSAGGTDALGSGDHSQARANQNTSNRAIDKCGCAQQWITRHYFAVKETDSREVVWTKKLMRIDLGTALGFSVIYSIFVIWIYAAL